MEQIQKRYVKFNTDTLDIVSIGKDLPSNPGFTILPVDVNLVLPFFTLEKNVHSYHPIIQPDRIVGFKYKTGHEPVIISNPESNSVKSLRSSENFIAQCDIEIEVRPETLLLRYNSTKFNSISAQENIENLTSSKDRVYNIYVTCKGDPFTIYARYETTLIPFITGKSIKLPYSGKDNISVYAIAKD